ncbi:hypothetical protein IMG5_171610 [Ichthyophthirius multifiliis]|uniref:Uncharacterized protein n=1 Tax=Ichthyophthirius multifiliis TaxID=5932 RepID=G0R1N1_ICHMU|nr:hypothetical protein IMG5_171610 [Ichthyophthirius multifiliis]EGR28625.1 hypothetical protein IMG5_171610 [Ichthyophthirius multifiliis]|eukprot:XP_004029861.1 hypothetical protein IMG5_171610 [Ichthyophthirius multifiliis]
MFFKKQINSYNDQSPITTNSNFLKKQQQSNIMASGFRDTLVNIQKYIFKLKKQRIKNLKANQQINQYSNNYNINKANRKINNIRSKLTIKKTNQKSKKSSLLYPKNIKMKQTNKQMLIQKESKENTKLIILHMDIVIKGKNIKENYMVGVFFGGLMEKYMRENFSKENIMDQESITGLQVLNITEILKMEKFKDQEQDFIKMEIFILENG